MKLIQSQNKLLIIVLVTIMHWLCLRSVATAQSNLQKGSDPDKDISQQLPPPVVPAPIKIGAPPLPVGLILNDKSVLEGINIRGSEDGEKAIEFERWLVPFDELMKALGIKIKEIGADTVELSSSSF